MGTWRDTQAAYFGKEVDSEHSENCTTPGHICDICLYALREEIGYNNYRTYCLLNDRYI